MQETEESAAKPETQGSRNLRLKEKRRIVKSQFFERITQLFILIRLDGVDACEDHRLDLLKSRKRFGSLPGCLRDRIADIDVGYRLDIGNDKTDLSSPEVIDLSRLWREHSQFFNLIITPFSHETDLHSFAQLAVNDPDHDDNPAIRIKPRIEDQGFERGLD